jgi:exodeoxyribonuclease V alpha subunit
MSIKLKAKAEREIYHNNDFRIVAFTPYTPYSDELKLSKYLNFICKGSNFTYITIGKDYELEIEELTEDHYGVSYTIIDCPTISKLDFHNLSREESFDILMDCTSSERIANNILDGIPNYIEKVLEDGEESIDTKLIKGVGEAYNHAYCRELLSKYKYYHLLIRHKEYELDTSDCKALYDTFITDDKIDHELEIHPYMSLIHVLQREFNRSDNMIMKNRPELSESDQRLEFAMLDVLDRNEINGSTKINANLAYTYLKDEYGLSTDLLKNVVRICDESNLIYYNKDTKELAKQDTYIAECRISNFINYKLDNSIKLDIDYTKYMNVDGFQLTDMQGLALKNFCESSISILSGVSGAGKTSSVKALVKLMEDNGLSYCLLSPTGSASLRLANQTNRNASTIHRKCLKDGEIDCDVIIVDEMSMVGIDVFVMLINTITNNDCRIVLCGDASQIPSISKGTIFSDMIISKKIPTVMLTQVFRYNTNGGSFVGENIRQGKKFLDNDIVKVNNNIYTIYNNYKFIQCDQDKIFENVLEEYGRLSKKYKLDDIIILVPFNIGECGSRAINRAIEDEYNPPKPNEKVMSYKIKNDEIIFRVGSKVVNTKNNYKALTLDMWNQIEESNGLLTEDDVELTQLFNGEIGTVRSIDDKKLVAQFNEQFIVFTKGNLHNLLLARAISTHRSQGGEWKAVINIVAPMHEKMLSKNLLYVSDTRGKEYHCDIGDRQTFENALLVDTVEERNTFLKELLLETKEMNN